MTNQQKRIDAVQKFLVELDAYGEAKEQCGKLFNPELSKYDNLVKAKDVSSETVQLRQKAIDMFIKVVEELYPVNNGE